MKKLALYFNASTALRIYLAFSLILIGALLLICRNPYPLTHPIIYAEDGTWTSLGLSHGWVYPLFHARPDYLVMGNVILLWIASQCCLVLFGNPIDHLPQSIAIVSYLFYSGVAVMAFYSTRGILPLVFRGALFIFLLLVPLGLSQNEIIGRIVQIGHYMPLIAIMLFYLRSRCDRVTLRSAIDFFIILCAATNPIVIGLAIIYFIWDYLQDFSIIKALVRNAILGISLLTLSIYLLPRMLDNNPTHLQGFDVNQLIEAISARAVLFSIIFPWYSKCFNFLSIFLLICWSFLITYCYLKCKEVLFKRFMLFLSAGLLMTTVATLVMRPGLTTILHNYQATYPDRYFMEMNVIAIFLTILALGQLALSSEKMSNFLGWIGLGAISILYISHFFLLFEYPCPEWVMNEPVFEAQVKSVSVMPNSELVDIPICPAAVHVQMQIPTKWIKMIQNQK